MIIGLSFHFETVFKMRAVFFCSPRCSIGLNLRVSGNGTLVVTKPENIQFIQPPITTIGKT